MNSLFHGSRRHFLHLVGGGLLIGASGPLALAAGSYRLARRPDPAFHADVEIELSARKSLVSILQGPGTQVWKYHARVLRGDRRCVEAIRHSYLGPIIRVEQGQKVRIFFQNELPDPCVTHWHGLHVPANMDGHPMDAIQPGQTLIYEFEIRNRAGTYWFHPHTHELTAKQVYFGLAGLFIVSDREEKSLKLPAGDFDVPLVLQDRSFDSDNQLRYLSHPMQTMTGFLGDRILVNGRPDFVLEAAARSYRLRLLNGSNSRIYKLAWDDSTPFTVIGTDGGLLEKPVTRDFVMLAPGERIDLWADFKNRKIGSKMTLRSLAFSASNHGMPGGMGHMGMGNMGMGRMGHGMMGAMMPGGLPLGGDYPLMTVRVAHRAEESSTLPQRLSSIRRLGGADASNRGNPRPIALSMAHRSPQINGRSYEMDNLLDLEKIPLNSLQLIEISHAPGGGMGMMHVPHPIHLHGQQFQVLERTIDPLGNGEYESVRAGYVDQGWKDTVLVMPGETVRILKPFDDFAGRFMFHCHNLEHEDAGMMRDFLVA
ncbi:MAG: multicopper oxidase family protein [Gammaproteobacteria bacterium]